MVLTLARQQNLPPRIQISIPFHITAQDCSLHSTNMNTFQLSGQYSKQYDNAGHLASISLKCKLNCKSLHWLDSVVISRAVTYLSGSKATV